ncbi:hypothetical protein V7195_25860 [Priestia megaterium]|uniref:hypothetical protein n=1 Tax=Priestia megaterium TaxID=1404 RepID=UPI000BF51F59|nr:hypothetical protein [Priestia megaterium]PFK01953.1 hypothetical protein COI96_06050 [Priestia megaterium]PMD08180.1 hypothetical protein CJ194_19480 [Priestia megaterium]
MKILTSNDFFYCYNKKLSDKIQEAGIPVITIAQNIKTGKLFSLYLKSSELQDAIDSYKEAVNS